ncbi:MAG TPA: enolase C-terminal domain-like protein [Pirellulaceae bacterium]|nr:enolase C-terminal domain-like protein [Pirellulaceae bacterium]
MQIARVETFRVNYAVRGHFKFFEQPDGKPPCRPTVVVKLTADGGTVGWGQCVPSPRWSYESVETCETTIRHYLAPILIGADPFAIDAIHAEMNRSIAPSFSTGQPIAKAGIDLALHDLVGRTTNQPTTLRLSPERNKQSEARPIALSWSINVRLLDDVGPEIEQANHRGYASFNVKVGPDLALDLELCRLVKHLAPSAVVWADANGGYDEESAAAAAKDLAKLGFAAIEQPLPANRLGGYQRLVQQRALPIVMDEGIVSCVELEEFHRLGLLDGVAMKVARCGGLTEAGRIMEFARNEGLMILGSGLTDPDLSLAASLILFSAYDLQIPTALNGPQYLTTSILRKPLVVENGAIAPPSDPGLGVEVDEAALLSA